MFTEKCKLLLLAVEFTSSARIIADTHPFRACTRSLQDLWVVESEAPTSTVWAARRDGLGDKIRDRYEPPASPHTSISLVAFG